MTSSPRTLQRTVAALAAASLAATGTAMAATNRHAGHGPTGSAPRQQHLSARGSGHLQRAHLALAVHPMVGPRTAWRRALAAPAPPPPPLTPQAPPPPVAPAPLAPTSTPTTPSAPPTTGTSGSTQPLGIAGNWTLVANWSFTGPSLPTDWRTGWFGSGVTAGVGGTSEADCYTPSNVTFPGDGTMHLNITQTPSTCDGETKPYSAAMVTTNPYDGRTGPGFQYTYGVLQAEVYVPSDGGKIADWPAVWTDGQSWPADGEDDIFEGLSGSACYHFHDPIGAPGGCDTAITPGWHTFASDWQPGSVTYYYDGTEVGQVTTGITSAPMFIIISNGVGYGTGGLIEPDSMQVASVRVWQAS